MKPNAIGFLFLSRVLVFHRTSVASNRIDVIGKAQCVDFVNIVPDVSSPDLLTIPSNAVLNIVDVPLPCLNPISDLKEPKKRPPAFTHYLTSCSIA
jgi:hypothetical protein